MSERRSVEVYFKMQESEEKFDYFLCSITGALFAYMAQNYVPKRLEFGVSALEPLALHFLVSSLFVGLLRIGYTTSFKRLNHIMLDAGEKAGKIATVLAQGGATYINELGGKISDRKMMELERQHYLEVGKNAEHGLERGKEKLVQTYRWRNISLCAGFILLLAGKLLQPYAHSAQNSLPHSPTAPAAAITATTKP